MREHGVYVKKLLYYFKRVRSVEVPRKSELCLYFINVVCFENICLPPISHRPRIKLCFDRRSMIILKLLFCFLQTISRVLLLNCYYSTWR